MKTLKVWHFLRNNGTTGKGRIKVKVGETMRVKGEIVPCHNGLHGSVRAIDALYWAPGNMVQRARLSGVIVPHAEGDQIDKYSATERTCLAIADATATLEYFARWCGLSVIDKWDASQVVLDFLMTGDEEIRGAAERAAVAACASTVAANISASHAAGAASASTAAAGHAASHAGGAAWIAAWLAAEAQNTARAAAIDAQNEELERLLNELMEEK